MSEKKTHVNSPTGRQTVWPARQLALMALFTALGIVFSFIEFPLLPSNFLKFDPSNVPAALGAIAFGPTVGSVIGTATALIHGLILGDFVGALMNISSVLAFVIPVGLLCRHKKSLIRIIVGLAVGVLLSTGVMLVMNLFVTPAYYGIPMQAVVDMIIPILLPFNILKAVINAALAFALFQSLHRLIDPASYSRPTGRGNSGNVSGRR